MKKSLLFVAVMLLGMSSVFAQDYALKFDAVDDTQSLKYGEDATTQLLDGATSYTIEAWVVPTDETTSGSPIFAVRDALRLTWWKNDADADVLGRFYVTHKQLVDGSIKNTYINTVDDAITLNEWNHIAVVCDATDGATGSIKLYVNGVDVTLQHYDAKGFDAVTATNNDIFVGYAGGGYGSFYAREIRMKNIAVPISEMVTDDHTNSYSTDANTAALLHFNEGSGLTTVNSASGVDANFGFSDGHYPTWVALQTTYLSLAKNNTTEFGIFPNPAVNGFVTIQAHNNELLSKVEVFNTLGKSVMLLDVENKAKVSFDVSGVAKGLYFVRASTNNGVATQKLVVE